MEEVIVVDEEGLGGVGVVWGGGGAGGVGGGGRGGRTAAAGSVAGGKIEKEAGRAEHQRMTGPAKQQGKRVCARMGQCRAFLDSLKLDTVYFDGDHDRCYCASCAAHIPDVLEERSAHGYKYEVPKGWCGFGLDVPARYAGSGEESGGCMLGVLWVL